MKGLLFCYSVELDPITAGLEGETSAASVTLQNDVTLAQDLLWAKVVVGSTYCWHVSPTPRLGE